MQIHSGLLRRDQQAQAPTDANNSNSRRSMRGKLAPTRGEVGMLRCNRFHRTKPFALLPLSFVARQQERFVYRAGFRAILVIAAAFAMPLGAWSANPPGRENLAWLDGPTWYAIAGSYHSQREAEAKARQLGDQWTAQNANICENYTKGLWVVVAGANSAEDAEALAAKVRGAYAKECK